MRKFSLTQIGIAAFLVLVFVFVGFQISKIKAMPVQSTTTATTPTPTQTTSSTPESHWGIDVETNPVTDAKTVTLSNRATWLPSGQGLAGSLIVRQTGRKLEVYVAIEDVLDDANMTCRFDDQKPIRIYGSRSTDYKGAFVSNPSAFLRQIESAKRLICMVNPYEHTAQPVVFDVAGFPSDQIKIPAPSHASAFDYAAGRPEWCDPEKSCIDSSSKTWPRTK